MPLILQKLRDSSVPYYFALLFLFLLAGGHIFEYFFLTDDAYITFRYLKNFLEGHGLVFNLGEAVEGYTNFLWLLLLAPFSSMGFSPEIVAPSLSILLSYGLLLILIHFCRQQFQLTPHSLLALIAPLLLVFNRTFAVFSTSGLETRLFTVCTFLAFVFFIRESSTPSQKYWSVAGSFLALSALTRPEGVLFIGMLILLRLLQRYLHSQSISANDWAFFGWAIVPVLFHFTFRLLYYGDWFPNTYYAKVGAESRFDYGYLYFRCFLFEHSVYLFLPFIALSILQALKKKQALPHLTTLFLFAPYLYFLAYQGGDHFEYRPLDVILPFLVFFTADGMLHCYHFFLRYSPFLARLGISAFLCILVCYTFLPGFMLHQQIREGNYLNAQIPQLEKAWATSPFPSFLTPTIQKFDRELSRLLQHFIGIRQEEHRKFWLKQKRQAHLLAHALETGKIKGNPSMALECVGVVPYFSNLPTLDILGLTDAYVAKHAPNVPQKNFYLAHEKRAPYDYLQHKQIALFPAHQASLFFEPALAIHQYGQKKNVYYAQFGELFFVFYSTLSDINQIRSYFAPEVPFGLLSELNPEPYLQFERKASSPLPEFYGIRNGSFETGDLTGWHPNGQAMSFQPTFKNNISARYFEQDPNHQGDFWLGTYEATTVNQQIRRFQMQGNEPQGTLTSEPFSVTKKYITFLMGGGALDEIYVEIWVEQVPLYRLHNPYSTDEMRRVSLNVEEFQGKSAQIHIVDASSEGWGHINVDDFRLED